MKLRINGNEREINAPTDMPLLWALRDLVGLRGTKYGCGIGMCGACTVHLNGEAVRSCQTPLDGVSPEDEITTIEGLGGGDGLHRVQAAWLEAQAPQCGYCQPGQIMQAAAMLAAIPDPSDEQIYEAMNGNLCRCGAYDAIRRAIRIAIEGPAVSISAASGEAAEG